MRFGLGLDVGERGLADVIAGVWLEETSSMEIASSFEDESMIKIL